MGGFNLTRVRELPDEVQKGVFDPHLVEIAEEIKIKFSLSPEQVKILDGLFWDLVYKDLELGKIHDEIEKRLDLDRLTALKLAFEFCEKVLGFFSEYYGNLSVCLNVIQKEIQKIEFKKQEEAEEKAAVEEEYKDKENKELKKVLSSFETTAGDFIKKFRDLADLKITESFIYSETLKKDIPGTLENWVKDYLYNVKNIERSSFERAQYLFESENVKKLGDEEKKIVAAVLRSYDQNTALKLARDGEYLEILNLEDFPGDTVKEKTDIPVVAPPPAPTVQPSSEPAAVVSPIISKPEPVVEIVTPKIEAKIEPIPEPPVEPSKSVVAPNLPIISTPAPISISNPIPQPVQPEVPSEPLITNLSQKEKDLIAGLGLVFDNEILNKRFNDILAGFMRGSRSRWKVIDTLSKNESMGGVGLEPDRAQSLIGTLEAKLNAELPVAPVKKVESLEVEPTDELQLIDKFFAHQGSTDIVIKNSSIQTNFNSDIVQNQTPQPALAPLPQVPVFNKITDIAQPRQAVGPIDELRLIGLDDLRHFSGGFGAALIRVKEKIQLAGENLPQKKVQALKAWKDSAVNRLYLQLGQESLAQGKNIATLLLEKQTAGLPSLTLEEFQMLTNLNQELRN